MRMSNGFDVNKSFYSYIDFHDISAVIDHQKFSYETG